MDRDGAIRRDQTGARAGSGHDSGSREEAGRASADGATGLGECDTAGAQTGGSIHQLYLSDNKSGLPGNGLL